MHAAILGWTFLSFQSQRQLRAPETEPIAVGVIAPSEVTKVSLGAPTAKQLEAEAKDTPKADLAKKEAAKPRPVAAGPPPPAPEPPAPKQEQRADPIAQLLAEPAPSPSAPAASPPAPDEQKKLDAVQQKRDRQAMETLEADAQRRAEELAAERRKLEEKRAEELRAAEKKRAQERLEEQRKQAELKRKEEEKKRKEAALKKKRDDEKKRQEAEAAKQKQFDADKIAALLNKVPNASAPPPSASPNKPTKAKEPALGAPDGRDKQISASELAMIGQIIKSCMKTNWTVLSGGASAQETAVKIRLRFKADGTLSTPPEIMNPQRAPYFLAISESAIRAVQQCEPFNLPPTKYDDWKDIVLNFHPRDMY